MRRQGYLFRSLVGLIAAVGLPLLGLVAYNLYQDSLHTRRAAYQAVENYASTIAQDVDSFLGETQNYLTFLAQRPLVAELNSAHCDPLLEGVVKRRKHFANVLITSLDGKPVCTSVRGPGQVPSSFATLDWFVQASAEDGFTLSKPFFAPIAQKMVLAMSAPLRNSSGRRIGTLSVLIDLQSLHEDWARLSLPPNSRLSLVDHDGTILVTRPAFEKFVGKDASVTIKNALDSNPDGVGIALGVDGVERAFALKPVPRARWRASAAIPADAVFAASRTRSHNSAAVALVVMAAVLTLGLVMARRMAAPLNSLSQVAKAVGRGDLHVRASELVPGEFNILAIEFNGMLDARQAAVAALTESERRFADLLANVDMVSLMVDQDGAITYCNDYLLSLTGWAREELIGKSWIAALLPTGSHTASAAFEQAMRGAPLRRHDEHPLLTRFGETRLVQWHNSVLRSTEGSAVGMASLGVDVTEVRNAQIRERRHVDFYRALSRTNSAIVRMPDADSLYREICGICVEHGHASIAYVSLIQGNALVQVASAGPAARFLANLTLLAGAEDDSSTGLSGVAARTGLRQVTNDCKADPRTAPWREATAHLGTKSVAAFPFRREGRTIGTLTLHMTIEGFFDERVIELVDEMTEDMSFALDNFAREEARAKAERQAKSDADRFRMLFQTAPVSMTITTVEERELLDSNEAYARLLGEEPSAQAGRPAFDDRLWSGDAERAFVNHLRSHGQVRNFELRSHEGTGSERDYLLQADFIEFANRPCVLTIANEITDLREAQRRVARQEQQLSGLVDTAMDAIISIDSEFRIKLFNRAAGELFMLAPEDALGTSIDRFVPNRLRTAHSDHVERFAKTGSTARRMGGLHSLVGLRTDGTEFPIEASISKVGEGPATLMTVVIRDATEVRRAEDARLARVAAESASQAKTAFLSRMSHELRTPLNAVLGFSQLLEGDEKNPLSPGHRLQVEHIRMAGWHLLALINDVLDISRIEAGKVSIETRDVDVHDLLDEVVRMNQVAADANHVTLAATYRESSATFALADPKRLRQVMINLISNAIKYNRSGGRAEVHAATDGALTHIDVVDTGIGMDASQLAQLYEPFNRLGRERNGIEGTGLGLALAKQLVQLMEGKMHVVSTPDVGTKIRVTLRACDGFDAKLQAPRKLVAAATITDDSSPIGVVLYIEDNPVNLLLVEQLLLRWPNVTLLQAETGAMGISIARSAKPDLILLDMRLPDMDGIEVLGALFDGDSDLGCQVVALSASAMPEEVAAARSAGACDYWTKPLDFDHFLTQVRKFLAAA